MTRKTFLTILALLIVTVLISVSPAIPSPYAISQITNNTDEDYLPQINSNGYAVWQEGRYGIDTEIFLYDGTDIKQITDNLYPDRNPKINDKGYVVWVGSDGTDDEIFLYDGISIKQITDNSYYDYEPQINNNGYVVWYGYDGTDYQIFLYDGINIKQITDNSYHDMYPQMNINMYPQINNKGYVVWEGSDSDNIDRQIFLYDGNSIKQITYGGYDPQINDNGYVVWYESGGWGDYRGDYEIFLYDSISIKQITNNSYYDFEPQINNNGYVVWYGYDDSDREIFLYDGTGVKQITNNSYEDYFPQINNNGYVVWSGFLDDHDSEVFLYDGTSTVQITDNAYADDYPQLNDKGDIVWHGFFENSDPEIFIAWPYLKMIYPNGSEIIPSGSICTIKWSALYVTKFDLFYSLNNGTTWKSIANNVTGTSYDWIVPIPVNNKNKCLVKVIGYALGMKLGEDNTDSIFTIEVAKVTSPDGGEILTSGSTHSIRWQTNGTRRPVAFVEISYNKNGGTTWKVINFTPFNPGNYDWKVPSVTTAKTRCKVRVRLYDASRNLVGRDVSDHLFTISP